jgi:hypothetical protein
MKPELVPQVSTASDLEIAAFRSERVHAQRQE